MTRAQRIGFSGLGMIGAPRVQCVCKAGFELFLDAADAARAATLAARTGAAVASCRLLSPSSD